MRRRLFLVLTLAYLIVLGLLWMVVWATAFGVWESLHFSVDTMTLRGRVSEPTAFCCAAGEVTFKIAEDVAAIWVFIVLGFGLNFYIKALEVESMKVKFRLDDRGGPFTDWWKRTHPETYARMFGPPDKPGNWWTRFIRWLNYMD